jgi:hypothetical protein
VRTTAERLEDLEEAITQLKRERLGAVSAAYAAVEAAMRCLRDERLIKGVNLRSIRAAMEQEVKETLSAYPDLLDAVRYTRFKRPFG